MPARFQILFLGVCWSEHSAGHQYMGRTTNLRHADPSMVAPAVSRETETKTVMSRGSRGEEERMAMKDVFNTERINGYNRALIKNPSNVKECMSKRVKGDGDEQVRHNGPACHWQQLQQIVSQFQKERLQWQASVAHSSATCSDHLVHM